jgi:hypothetical protein
MSLKGTWETLVETQFGTFLEDGGIEPGFSSRYILPPWLMQVFFEYNFSIICFMSRDTLTSMTPRSTRQLHKDSRLQPIGSATPSSHPL